MMARRKQWRALPRLGELRAILAPEVLSYWTERARHSRKVDRAKVEFGRLDYPNADIYLKMDSVVGVLRLKSCKKEPWTVAWLEGWLQPGQVLYDVGANVGAYSLVAAAIAGKTGRVVALEPGYPTFAALCENVLANDAAEIVLPLPVSLSEDTGMAFFSYQDLRAGAASQTLENGTPSGPAATAFRQPVLAYRLDDLIDQFSLPEPDHLKLDVDGPELSVLRGATRTLGGSRLQSLMVEMSDAESEAVLELLESHGFSLQESHRREKGGKPVDHSYGLFARAPD